jgi:Outer membrane protein beta-barrel family
MPIYIHIHKILVLLISISVTSLVTGQSSGILKGKLQDSMTLKNLPFGTITVFRAEDTIILSYKLSDPEGNFKITNLPLDLKCRVLISYSGYKVYRQDLLFSKNKREIDLGLLKLSHDSKSLEEILIAAEYPPIIVRNDTIEFNASSFKTLPNALVEDLLKKLPGVNVTKNGEIYLNGKVVNRIIVDGKEFFGRDPKIATRNLPANIIDKVQVMDDNEDIEQNLYLNKADAGKIINLKLKKGVKKGVFGKVYAGIGTVKRYEAGGIANLFRDTLQISLLGYSNNLNKPGFGMADVKDIGGFSRSGYSSSMVSQNGAFALDGISFGATSEGIQKSSGAGFNFNTEFGKKITANLTYFLGQINSDLEENRNSQQFLLDTILNVESLKTQYTTLTNNRLGSSIKWSINPSSTLTIKPVISFTDNYSNQELNTTEKNNTKGLLNQSFNRQNFHTTNSIISTNLSFRKNFFKKGRTVYFGSNFLINNNCNKLYSLVKTTFYANPTNYDSLDQLRTITNPNFVLDLSGRYVEPISKSIRFVLTHSISYNNYDNQINSFHKSLSSNTYNTLIDSLSNSLNRKVFNNTTSIGFDFLIKKINFFPSVAIKQLSINNITQRKKYNKRNSIYFLPGFNFNWNGLYLSYSSTASEPSAIFLRPVLDNTNPLFIQLGNLELLPTLTHSIYFTYDKYDYKKSITYRFLFNSLSEENGIITNRYIDVNGVQVYQPINGSGIRRFRSSNTITKNFKFIHNSMLTIGATLYVDYSKTYFIINNEKGLQRTWNLKPSLSYSFNWNDKIDISQELTMPFSKSTYENNFFPTIYFLTNSLNTDITIRPTNGIAFESSINYYYTSNVADNLDKNLTLWNAAFHYSFLKNDKADLKFSVFNLLRQTQNISRIIMENFISDIRVKNLNRYFLTSITYNLSDFENHKSRKERLLFF